LVLGGRRLSSESLVLAACATDGRGGAPVVPDRDRTSGACGPEISCRAARPETAIWHATRNARHTPRGRSAASAPAAALMAGRGRGRACREGRRRRARPGLWGARRRRPLSARLSPNQTAARPPLPHDGRRPTAHAARPPGQRAGGRDAAPAPTVGARPVPHALVARRLRAPALAQGRGGDARAVPGAARVPGGALCVGEDGGACAPGRPAAAAGL